MKPCDRLLFGTAGIPLSAEPRNSLTGLSRLVELGLDSMEFEYVRGMFPGRQHAREVAAAAKELNIRLTAHAPYYINLNAEEPEKKEASRNRILKTAIIGSLSGAESITFHAGFFLGHDADEVYDVIRDELTSITAVIAEKGIEVDVRPELTGKAKQFGSLEEILRLSKEVQGVHPCIDWAHLHSRTGENNTAGEFQVVLDTIRSSLGEQALKNLHMHIAGIDYSPKGEKKHLNLEESDLNYKDLLCVLKDNDVHGIVVCESPSIEGDAVLLKEFYEKL